MADKEYKDPHQLEAERAEKEKQRRLQLEQEQEDVRWLMSLPQGRRLMWRLLALTGVFRSSFTGNSETFFKEGRRDIGLTFLDDVQSLTPEDFVTMLQEHKAKRPNSESGGHAK